MNDGVYLTIMWLLILVQLVEGFYLGNNWLLGGAAWAYGVQFADRYRDNKALMMGHYSYAIGLIVFWLGATGWDLSTLIIPAIVTVLCVGLNLINKRWEFYLLAFELAIFATTQIHIWGH